MNKELAQRIIAALGNNIHQLRLQKHRGGDPYDGVPFRELMDRLIAEAEKDRSEFIKYCS